jgi:hypothetical protein
MRPREMFGLGQLFTATPMLTACEGGSDSKLLRRLTAIACEPQEVNVRAVAESRAEWLRRAAMASRHNEVDPRLRATRSTNVVQG